MSLCHLLLIVASVGLLSACAPATTGLAPSGALQQQLEEIRQQQRAQEQIIAQLKQQIEQLSGQRPGQAIIPGEFTETSDPQEQSALTPDEQVEPISIPLIQSGAQDAQEVAASASTYLAAFSDLAAGRWSAAEQGFSHFISAFADHQYVSNARYWMAHAQLSQNKTVEAEDQLRQIISDPKGQAKAPAALLLLEQSYRNRGLIIEADDVAEQLLNRFPESPEALNIDRETIPN